MLRSRTPLAVGLALALVLLGVLAVMPALADHIAIHLTELGPRAEFTDDVTAQFKIKLDGRATEVVNMRDPSNVVTAEITVQPGARFPWHTHHGAVVVSVIAGELVYISSEDCVERSYEAGEAFVDPGHGHVHSAFNPSSTEDTVLIATFFGAPPAGTGLSIVDPDEQDLC